MPKHMPVSMLAQGLSLLTRNFRSRLGEIDLIMDDGQSLVFVEVRYRRGNAFGSGAESVNRRKQARITACAQHYLCLLYTSDAADDN